MAARDRVARTAEVTGGVTAAGVGTALGYTKLRDAYKRDYGPKLVNEGAAHVERLAPKASRVARALSHGEPGFIPLAVGAGGATVATAASRYRKHRQRVLHPVPAPTKPGVEKSVSATSSAFGVDHGQADIAKGLQAPNETKTLRAVGDASNSVNALRHKVVPSGIDLIRIADKKTSAVRAKVGTIGKAFDPAARDRDHARKARNGLLTAGSSSLGYSVVQRNAGAAATRRAVKQEGRAARYYGEAGAHNGRATADLHSFRASPHGKGNTLAAFDRAHTSSHKAGRAMFAARGEALRGAANRKASVGHMRLARNYRLGGAALLGGAYIAHRKATTAN